ncbi:hypothetical protein PSUB009319_35010 [Ralstonia sp. SET104]|nr:hypothetical protein PSUB009319_35010 [Ralstonia sp. SET104]
MWRPRPPTPARTSSIKDGRQTNNVAALLVTFSSPDQQQASLKTRQATLQRLQKIMQRPVAGDRQSSLNFLDRVYRGPRLTSQRALHQHAIQPAPKFVAHGLQHTHFPKAAARMQLG